MASIVDLVAALSDEQRDLLERSLRHHRGEADRPAPEPIAVVGMACRFPNATGTPEEFWTHLRHRTDLLRGVPPDRWDPDAIFDDDPDARGKVYVRAGAFLDQAHAFDAEFFAISPAEAREMDPQHRLVLEVGWEALESAGIAPDRLAHSATGIFVGIFQDGYAERRLRLGGYEAIDGFSMVGSIHSIGIARLAHLLGLQGPCLAIDTACSSSLAAIHLACESLRRQECDLVLAGGVVLQQGVDMNMMLCRLGLVARDGRSKSFDARADGFGQGDGCGMVALRRLADAEAKGDRILAVIAGSAMNHDGRSASLTAPNSSAQAQVIRRALAAAGREPAQVSYVETHGTGTRLGDPIEANALGEVYGAARPDRQPLMIGAVKANIGHLDSAAGVAGLIKVILSLHHEEIPPHFDLAEVNPAIPLERLRLAIPTEVTPWPAGDRPRLAGVSGFGAAGTNVHLLVEEAPRRAAPPAAVERPLHLLALSARSPDALAASVTRLERWMERHGGDSIADICFSSNAGRAHFAHRVAVVAGDREELRGRLRGIRSGERQLAVAAGTAPAARGQELAFLFTGQGSQYSGMARELHDTQPSFRRALRRCADGLAGELERPLLSVLFEPDDARLLDQTAYTQPALFALEVALAEMWRSWGVVPTVVAGHSVGEYAAACVAGVMSLEDGLRLIAARGRLIQAMPPGDMAAAFCDRDAAAALVSELGPDLSIASINGPRNVVLSGTSQAVTAAVDRLAAAGIRTQRLTVSHAFHSAMLDPMLDEFRRVAESVALSPPQIPFVTNLTGRPAGDGSPESDVAGPDYWCRQTRQAVQFAAGMQALAEHGCRTFLEIGPSATLLGMGQQCIGDGETAWLPSLRRGRPDWHQLLDTLAGLYTRGFDVDWAGFDADYQRRRVSLPTYPFQRKTHILEPTTRAVEAAAARRGPALHPLLGHRLAASIPLFESVLRLEDLPYLADHRVENTPLVPAAAFIELALAAARQLDPDAVPAVEDVHLDAALPLSGPVTVQLAVTPGDGGGSFRVSSLASDGSWTVHARGALAARAPVGRPASAAADGLEAVDVEAHYRRAAALGLEYGRSFRALRAIERRDGEARGTIQLQPGAAAAGYHAHPTLLDGCLQLAAAAMTPPADSTLVHLPTAIGRAWVHPDLPDRLDCRATTAEEGGLVRATFELLDGGGALVGELGDVLLRPVPRASLQRALAVTRQPAADDHLYAPTWRAAGDTGRPAGLAGDWILLADRGGVARALAGRLRADGHKCVLVQPGAADDAVTFSEALRAHGDSCAGVIHLRALDGAGGTPASLDSLPGAARSLSGSLLEVIQELAAARATRSPRLWIATRGAQPVGDGRDSIALEQAAVWGIGRTLAHEHPELWGGLIDLDPAAAVEAAAGQLLDALAVEGEDQQAWRGGRRHVLRLARLAAPPPGAGLAVRADATYLVTGGLGGLGARLARHLAARGARHLVLVGRRGAESRGQSELMDDLRAAGVEVVFAAADVADARQVADILATIRGAMPPLRGIAHCAGTQVSAPMRQLGEEDLAGALAAKVLGAWNLDRLSQDDPLDFFLLYSSATSVLGLYGQAGYAAGNAFMDALAHRRRRAGRPALSVNWGPWAEVGMAAAMGEHGLRQWRRWGIDLIDPAEGLALLDRLVDADPTQALVLPVSWSRFRLNFPAGRAPLYADLASDQRGDLVDRLLAHPEADRTELLVAYLRGKLAEVMGWQPEALTAEIPLAAAGVDSLLAVAFRLALEADIGRPLASSTPLEHATLRALADHLLAIIAEAPG